MILNKEAKSSLNNSFISKLPLPYICKKMIAFTLAEVLITLLIIGVVASLIIPPLVHDTQDAELKVAWKKEFGVLSQSTRRILSENGGSFINFTNTYNHNFLRDQYLQYMSIIKKCDKNNNYGICWNSHDTTSGDNGIGVTKYLNGSNALLNSIPLGSGSAGSILNDGTYILFAYQDSTCTSQNPPINSADFEGISGICGWIAVDVNGKKRPNIVGKDIFNVWITKNGILPNGTKNNRNTCISSGTGLGCSALYLK